MPIFGKVNQIVAFVVFLTYKIVIKIESLSGLFPESSDTFK